MAAQIHLTDPITNGEYTLEFDRDSVKYAESLGFDLTRAETTVATDVICMFRAAFHKHHPRLDLATIDGIWDRISDKKTITEALIEMFNEPYRVLFSEPEGDSKNVATFKVVK